MPIAEKILESMARSSWIRKMFEEGARRKAQFGEDNVFDFSLGNPNLEPPDTFKKVLRELVDELRPGPPRLYANAGFVETRQAVADYLTSYNRRLVYGGHRRHDRGCRRGAQRGLQDHCQPRR